MDRTMRVVWKTLLWVAIGVLPGGVLLLPFALRRPPAKLTPGARA